MRVAIDIRRIGDFGVGTYTWNLVHALAQLTTSDAYFLLGSEQDFKAVEDVTGRFWTIPVTDRPMEWREHISIPLALHRNDIDVLHVPHPRPPALVPCRLIVTFHDCIHLRFPEEGGTRSALYTRYVARRADRLIAVSQSTKDDLRTLLNVPEKRITVIHNAPDMRVAPGATADEEALLRERYQLQDPFILYAGAIRPHKNVKRLIEAFGLLKNRRADDESFKRIKLVLVGDELSRNQSIRLAVVRNRLQQDVRFFGFVPGKYLGPFYRAAALFVCPSLYEGFGLPPLEAMANGTPVVSSNTSALPEVLGDAALFVNPMNAFDIANGMEQVLGDEGLRQQLIQRGHKQAAAFSWQATAAAVAGVYSRSAEPL